MTNDNENGRSIEEQLSQLFGGFRAEWLKDRLFDLFTKPSYFPELETSRPCMLVGGRGTGKTTVLRGLSYEGQFALHGQKVDKINNWPYYGVYYRVNTNRVTAFKGDELDEDGWIALFAHYLNLLFCDLTFSFLEWYQLRLPSAPQLTAKACRRVAISLNLPEVGNIEELAESLDLARVRFEAYINNVVDGPRPLLSMQSSPMDTLLEAVLELPQFEGKSFFFLVDEYENFESYQQRIVNTLIKHCGQLYSFKVGVKELGLKHRATLIENEQLISPADYSEINIADKLEGDTFREFALSVCNDRIAKIKGAEPEMIRDVVLALASLSEDEEAERLGITDIVTDIKRKLSQTAATNELEVLAHLDPLQIYLIDFWSKGEGRTLEDEFRDFINNRSEWNTRYGNYKHALLYTIKRRKAGIRKYYAGWEVFTQMAGNNIRYLLELVVQSLLLHLQNKNHLTHPVSPAIQTEAAQRIGKKNLIQLEGLSVHGAQLTKLLLGLGRIFETMAADAFGHAPEVNQFHLNDVREHEEVKSLIDTAVMHLALLRSPGNKLSNQSDIREFDYMVHPIFSAFFVFSYRRKRKMTLSGSEILGLVEHHRPTIREILARTNRRDDEPLPDQLNLFEAYYYGDQ